MGPLRSSRFPSGYSRLQRFSSFSFQFGLVSYLLRKYYAILFPILPWLAITHCTRLSWVQLPLHNAPLLSILLAQRITLALQCYSCIHPQLKCMCVTWMNMLPPSFYPLRRRVLQVILPFSTWETATQFAAQTSDFGAICD